MCWICFDQHQASSAALRWLGMWVLHVMCVQHRWLATAHHRHTAWWPMVVHVLVFFSLGFIFRATRTCTCVYVLYTTLSILIFMYVYMCTYDYEAVVNFALFILAVFLFVSTLSHSFSSLLCYIYACTCAKFVLSLYWVVCIGMCLLACLSLQFVFSSICVYPVVTVCMCIVLLLYNAWGIRCIEC